jgi:hypothetical protein
MSIPRAWAEALRDPPKSERNQDQANRDIQPEDPLPRDALSDCTAQDWTDDQRKPCDAAEIVRAAISHSTLVANAHAAAARIPRVRQEDRWDEAADPHSTWWHKVPHRETAL